MTISIPPDRPALPRDKDGSVFNAPCVLGRAVPYVLGDPHLTPEHERALRRKQVLLGLQSLCTTVTSPTLHEVQAA